MWASADDSRVSLMNYLICAPAFPLFRFPTPSPLNVSSATWRNFLGSANRHFLRPTCQPHQRKGQIKKNRFGKTYIKVIGPPKQHTHFQKQIFFKPGKIL